MNTYSNFIERALHPAFNIGDRVYVNQYGVLATVVNLEYEYRRKQYWYHVKFDKAVPDVFGDGMKDTGCYGCFGIASEFDSEGNPIYGPLHYRQSLFEFVPPYWYDRTREFSFDCGVDIKATLFLDESGHWKVEKTSDGKTFTNIMKTDELCMLLAELYKGDKQLLDAQ